MATSKTKAKTARATRAPAKPAPHRYRFSVPAADEAVSAWMETQDDPSHSLRALIRENIERHGYTDIVNRPVAQLPKRGRPVAGDADFVEEDAVQQPAVVAGAPQQQPAPTTQSKPQPAPKTQAEPVAPVAAVAVEPEPEPEQDPVVSEYIPEVMGPDIANFIPGLDDDEDEPVAPAPAPASVPAPAPATASTPVETSSGAAKAFDNNIFGALR